MMRCDSPQRKQEFSTQRPRLSVLLSATASCSSQLILCFLFLEKNKTIIAALSEGCGNAI